MLTFLPTAGRLGLKEIFQGAAPRSLGSGEVALDLREPFVIRGCDQTGKRRAGRGFRRLCEVFGLHAAGADKAPGDRQFLDQVFFGGLAAVCSSCGPVGSSSNCSRFSCGSTICVLVRPFRRAFILQACVPASV